MLSEVFYDSSNGLHLFYHGFMAGKGVLYHAYSPDEVNFTRVNAIAEIATEYRGIFFPAIVFDGDSIYIVFQARILSGGILTDKLFFVSSHNAGKSFSGPKMITPLQGSDSSPSLFMHKNILYCVYQNNEMRYLEIKLIRGYNRGKEWDLQPVTVSDINMDCYNPRIVGSSDDELLIVLNDMRERYQAVSGRKFSLIDNSLSGVVRISDANVASHEQFPVVVGKQVLLFWNSNERLLGKFSDISVQPFDAPRSLMRNNGNHHFLIQSKEKEHLRDKEPKQ